MFPQHIGRLGSLTVANAGKAYGKGHFHTLLLVPQTGTTPILMHTQSNPATLLGKKLIPEIMCICKKILTAQFITAKKPQPTNPMPNRGSLTLYSVTPSRIFKISICMRRQSSRSIQNKLLMAVVSTERDCQVETPFSIFNEHSFTLFFFYVFSYNTPAAFTASPSSALSPSSCISSDKGYPDWIQSHLKPAASA